MFRLYYYIIMAKKQKKQVTFWLDLDLSKEFSKKLIDLDKTRTFVLKKMIKDFLRKK